MKQVSLRRRLLNLVRHDVIPCLEPPERWRIVLGEPPFGMPDSVASTFHRGRPLTNAEGRHTYFSPGVVHYWPRLEVHSNRFPYMGFVVQGEINWPIGITTAMAKKLSPEHAHSDHVTLRLPQSTFFLMPPGVPYASGSCSLHSAAAANAKFEIFWVRFQSSGVQCHVSHNEGREKVSEPNLYLHDARLYTDAQTLIEELRLGQRASLKIIRSLLLLMTYNLERGFEQQLTEDITQIPHAPHNQKEASQAVEQACLYIESHYNQKLTLEAIAANAFLSPGHLCRVFKKTKGVSVNAYVTRFRLQYACQLLQDTEMQISAIGRNVGYHNLSYFCQIFERHFGCSPGKFREKRQDN